MVHRHKRAPIIDLKSLVVKIVVELPTIRSEAVVPRGWSNLLQELREEVVDWVLRDEEAREEAATKVKGYLDRVHGHPTPWTRIVRFVV